MTDNSIDETSLSEVLCSFDKIETITKVLNQTLFENSDFDAKDSQNLCSVLLREISYVKVKLGKIEKTFSTKLSCR